MKDVIALAVELLALGCFFALPAALVKAARRESHPEHNPVTLVEQAERWSGGAS
ncbi:hypothetical protein ABZ682_22610 [Streptomyces griseoviridis]|uniref:hypothetical protein n=1 Tax=Streptomyces griseoviridis TaxID=45398 RepID=UPI0033ECF065